MARHPKLIYVEYIDHGSGSEWRDFTALNDAIQTEDNCRCRAIGWLIREDKRILLLSNFVTDDNSASHTRIYIVKGAITKRKVLHDPRR